MKPVKRLYLSTDEVHLVDVSLVLELNSCGRGFITAETTTDYTGKLVRLDVGYTDLLLRWFTGYVERSQPAENGFQRLFIRELVQNNVIWSVAKPRLKPRIKPLWWGPPPC